MKIIFCKLTERTQSEKALIITIYQQKSMPSVAKTMILVQKTKQ